MARLILATTSKSRIKTFNEFGVDFTAHGSDIDEYFDGRPKNAEELCLCLAKMKALDVARHYEEGIVLGFDSVSSYEGRILEKPRSKEEQLNRIKELSGNSLTFYTGIYLLDISGKRNEGRVVATEATIKTLDDLEINRYLASDPDSMGYTVGFNPLAPIASTFTEKINGSYMNYLTGIPMETIAEMLQDFGIRAGYEPVSK